MGITIFSKQLSTLVEHGQEELNFCRINQKKTAMNVFHLFIAIVIVVVSNGESAKIPESKETIEDRIIRETVKEIKELKASMNTAEEKQRSDKPSSFLGNLHGYITMIDQMKDAKKMVALGEKLKTAIKKKDLKTKIGDIQDRIAKIPAKKYYKKKIKVI